MKTSELVKLLRYSGCKLVEHGARHDKWYCPKTGKYVRVGRHGAEIAIGTVSSILKDAGLK